MGLQTWVPVQWPGLVEEQAARPQLRRQLDAVGSDGRDGPSQTIAVSQSTGDTCSRAAERSRADISRADQSTPSVGADETGRQRRS